MEKRRAVRRSTSRSISSPPRRLPVRAKLSLRREPRNAFASAQDDSSGAEQRHYCPINYRAFSPFSLRFDAPSRPRYDVRHESRGGPSRTTQASPCATAHSGPAPVARSAGHAIRSRAHDQCGAWRRADPVQRRLRRQLARLDCLPFRPQYFRNSAGDPGWRRARDEGASRRLPDRAATRSGRARRSAQDCSRTPFNLHFRFSCAPPIRRGPKSR
jgi:hypothetical protein